jgi:phage terminase small subunit
MPLTSKQERFVQEYLVDLNATQAAIRAGYSEKTAYSIGQENLRKPEVLAAITQAQEERAKRTEITQDVVLKELALLSLSNVKHYQIDDEGHVKLVDGVPEEANRAVSSIKRKVIRGKDGQVTYETILTLWDKPACLRMCGQHLGMFKEKLDVSVEADNLYVALLHAVRKEKE